MSDSHQGLSLPGEARISMSEVRASLIVNTNVTDITERAAQSALAVAQATHVTPKKIVVGGAVIGTVAIAISVFVVLWMTHAWGLHWAVSLGAVAAIAVPFGVVATKVLPKLLEQAAGVGH